MHTRCVHCAFEGLYLSNVTVTVRCALKTSYCGDKSAHSTALPQSLWDGTVWDITGGGEREISFLFILSGSAKTSTTPHNPPFPPYSFQLKHTQTACLQGCCSNQTLISFNWWETNHNSFLKSAFILRPQRSAKHKDDRTKWSGRKWDDCYSFIIVPFLSSPNRGARRGGSLDSGLCW